jgi:hypothetical protein
LDEVDVKEFVKLFNETLKVAEHYLALRGYRVLGSRYLVAVDGVMHFSSPEIHCEHCLRRTVNGKVQYYHEMIAAVVVKAGDCISLPLMPVDLPPGGRQSAKPHFPINHSAQYT